MERLHLHHPDGTLLATFDLDGLPKRPLTLGTAPSADLRLPGGPDILGALMRDEDGWLLAAAAPAEGATESRLEPGEPDSLADIRLAYSRSYLEVPFVAEHWARYRDDPAHLLLLPDDSGIVDWLALAREGKCDAIVLTLAGENWDADNTNLDIRDDFREAGDVASAPLFLTLSPQDPAFAARVLDEFERGMARLEADGTLARLRALYFPPPAD